MTALDTKALLVGVTPGDWEANCFSLSVGTHRIAHFGPIATKMRADSTNESEANAKLAASAPRLARRVIELEEALANARQAIASLDVFALGGVQLTDTHTGEPTGQYGIRDELLAKIDAALTTQGEG